MATDAYETKTVDWTTTTADASTDTVTITTTNPSSSAWIINEIGNWHNVEWNPNQIMRDDQKLMDGMTDRDKEGIEERETSWDDLFAAFFHDELGAAITFLSHMGEVTPGMVLDMLALSGSTRK